MRQEFRSLDKVRLARDTGATLRSFQFSECSGGAAELVGVARPRLQQLLLQAAGPERVVLDAPVESVDAESGRVTLADGRSVGGRLLLGADGVRSAVAAAVGVPPAGFVGQAGFRGIADFERGSAPGFVGDSAVCQVRHGHPPCAQIRRRMTRELRSRCGIGSFLPFGACACTASVLQRRHGISTGWPALLVPACCVLQQRRTVCVHRTDGINDLMQP